MHAGCTLHANTLRSIVAIVAKIVHNSIMSLHHTQTTRHCVNSKQGRIMDSMDLHVFIHSFISVFLYYVLTRSSNGTTSSHTPHLCPVFMQPIVYNVRCSTYTVLHCTCQGSVGPKNSHFEHLVLHSQL